MSIKQVIALQEYDKKDDIELIPIEIDFEEERLNDAIKLAESAKILKSLNEDIIKLLEIQGETLENSDEKIAESEIIILESNDQLVKAAKWRKLKFTPILIGAGIGAALFGIPSAFLIGSYSALTATGGGVLGGYLGKKLTSK